MRYIIKGILNLTGRCAKDNRGIGVVELILILVGIFINNYVVYYVF